MGDAKRNENRNIYAHRSVEIRKSLVSEPIQRTKFDARLARTSSIKNQEVENVRPIFQAEKS